MVFSFSLFILKVFSNNTCIDFSVLFTEIKFLCEMILWTQWVSKLFFCAKLLIFSGFPIKIFSECIIFSAKIWPSNFAPVLAIYINEFCLYAFVLSKYISRSSDFISISFHLHLLNPIYLIFLIIIKFLTY